MSDNKAITIIQVWQSDIIVGSLRESQFTELTETHCATHMFPGTETVLPMKTAMTNIRRGPSGRNFRGTKMTDLTSINKHWKLRVAITPYSMQDTKAPVCNKEKIWSIAWGCGRRVGGWRVEV